jgi:hypothetical protein
MAETESLNAQNKQDTVTIIVNGRSKQVVKEEISFEEILALAGFPPPSEGVEYTVLYHRGHGNKPEGTLTAGASVRVKDGMIFNVTPTNRS